MCRRRIPSSYKIPTNYSLLSLIEKNDSKQKTETRSQETQTDPPQHIEQITLPQVSQTRRNSSSRRGTTSKHSIKFKFMRDQGGGLEGMEISML